MAWLDVIDSIKVNAGDTPGRGRANYKRGRPKKKADPNDYPEPRNPAGKHSERHTPKHYTWIATQVLRGRYPAEIAQELGVPPDEIRRLVYRSPRFKSYLKQQQVQYEAELRNRIADEFAKLIVDNWAGPI